MVISIITRGFWQLPPTVRLWYIARMWTPTPKSSMIDAYQYDQDMAVLHVRFAVVAIGVVLPRGPRKPARALVEADGVG